MPCECHNSDAEHEVALSIVRQQQELRGFIIEIFSLPSVETEVHQVEVAEMCNKLQRWLDLNEGEEAN